MVCVLFMHHIQAQSIVADHFGNFNTGGVIQFSEITFEGSIYFADSWLAGNVTAANKAHFKDLQLRYNLKDQTVLVKIDEEKLKIVDANEIARFQITDAEGTTHEFVNANKYKIKGTPVKGFIEYLMKGDLELAYKYNVKLKPAEKTTTYGTGGSAVPGYTLNVMLFASTDGKTLIPVKSKKDLLALFGDKSSQMKAYTKKNKVKLRDHDAMTALVEYYESL